MRKIFLVLKLLVVHFCGTAQSIWIPPKPQGLSQELYNDSETAMKIAAKQLSDPELPFIDQKINRFNLFYSYAKLEAPLDTVAKYMNLVFLYHPDFVCEYLFTNQYSATEATFARDFVRRYDSTLYQNTRLRCADLFESYDSVLIRQLDTIRIADQEIREKLEAQGNPQFGGRHAAANALWRQQLQRDSLNQRKMEKILFRYGYPGRQLVGSEHAGVLFSVLQHAPLALQEKYLYLIRAAAEKDQLDQQSAAYLTDRIRMNKGLKQKYGTQLVFNPKKEALELYPIENMAGIDALRKSAGLEPLHEYLHQYGIKEIRKP